MNNGTEDKKGRRWALVTGASSGIGYEVAKLFDQKGYCQVLVARREERLHELQKHLKNESRILSTDLRDPAKVLDVFTYCKDSGIEIDLLVNNAGFGYNGEFVDESIQMVQDMIQVNITALVTLTRLFLSEMLKRNRGCIVQMASVAAFFPGPYMANYYATKNYVLSFSRALAYELKSSEVHILTVCPGPVKTEFGQVAGVGKRHCLLKHSVKTPSKIAEITWEALQLKKTVVVCGGLFTFLVFFRCVFSKNLLVKIIATFNRAKRL